MRKIQSATLKETVGEVMANDSKYAFCGTAVLFRYYHMCETKVYADGYTAREIYDKLYGLIYGMFMCGAIDENQCDNFIAELINMTY